MKVTKLSNGQFEVKHENLTLTHQDVNGMKFNDCTIKNGEFFEAVSQYDSRFKPLFIALHNFKNS